MESVTHMYISEKQQLQIHFETNFQLPPSVASSAEYEKPEKEKLESVDKGPPCKCMYWCWSITYVVTQPCMVVLSLLLTELWWSLSLLQTLLYLFHTHVLAAHGQLSMLHVPYLLTVVHTWLGVCTTSDEHRNGAPYVALTSMHSVWMSITSSGL